MKLKGKKSKVDSVMSVDELMADVANSDGDSDYSDEEPAQKPKKKKVKTKQKEPTKLTNKSSSRKHEAQDHAASLSKLQDQDPEFYEFLKKEDKDGLLSFNPDDIEDSSDDSDASDHDPSGTKLEVQTDSEEDEDSDEDTSMKTKQSVTKSTKKRINVTMAMVKQWSASLREQDSVPAFHQCVTAFKAAIRETSGDGQTDGAPQLKYKVEGSLVFNAIIRVCMLDMMPMLNRVLKVPTKHKDTKKPPLPSFTTKWVKVKLDVKSYLTDLIQFISQLSEPTILNVVLKHVHQSALYYVCFPRLTKMILKRLMTVWSSGEETSRVLAFLSIIKITRITQDSFLEFVVKQMYMSFVQNCKFTSPTTLPLINFMQRSLVEIFGINVGLTYQYAFIYIRQMAIHLRNAITVKKKETCQAVYNWQYVHSLNLWVRLLSQTHPNETLEPLIYPLTQVVIGTIKLIPSARYYPLRFHCVRSLNMLADATNTYIPTLPFLTELFEQTDFNKTHKSISFKPFNFACILKLTQAQLQEKAFRDGIIDQTYDLLLESFAIHANSVSFPELALPAVIQIKDFLKKCKVVNFTKVMRQMLEKVQANSDFITKERRKAGLTLNDMQRVDAWERKVKADGTPLGKLFDQYKKKRVSELQQEIAGKERISSENLPKIDRRPILGKATAAERKEFRGLFESDSDDDDDGSSDSGDDSRFLLKEERSAKKRKLDEESDKDSDEYSDFNEEEMEALDRSASESEADENESDKSDTSESESKNKKRKVTQEEYSESEDVSDTGDIVQDFEFSDSDNSDAS